MLGAAAVAVSPAATQPSTAHRGEAAGLGKAEQLGVGAVKPLGRQRHVTLLRGENAAAMCNGEIWRWAGRKDPCAPHPGAVACLPFKQLPASPRTHNSARSSMPPTCSMRRISRISAAYTAAHSAALCGFSRRMEADRSPPPTNADTVAGAQGGGRVVKSRGMITACCRAAGPASHSLQAWLRGLHRAIGWKHSSTEQQPASPATHG